MTLSAPALPASILEALLGGVPSALFVLDANGRVMYANALAASLVRRTPASVLGCNVAEEFGQLLSADWDQACHRARAEDRTVEYEIHNVALAGWFRLVLTPVQGTLVVHIKDTTELNRMAQLQTLSAALARCATPDEVIEVTLSQAVSTVGAYLGAVFEVDPDGEHLQLIGNVGYPETLRANAQSVSLRDHFPPCESVLTGRSLFLLGDALDQRFVGRAEIRSARTRSLASLPLLVEERALGVLVLSFETEQVFGPPAQAFLGAFALQCAQALERAQGQALIETSRERLAFLASASELLALSLDIQETLGRLGQLAARHIADWVVVILPDDTGQLQLVSAAHRDPGKLALLEAFMDEYPLDMNGQQGAVQVYLTGQSSLVETVPTSVIDAVKDANKRQMARDLKLESLITVPLTTHGRVIGAMSFASSDPLRRYTHADLELAEELARRAAATIENAQLFQAAQDGEARLAGIIGTVTDAVVTWDEEGQVVLFNAAAEQMFGLKAAAALGHAVERFRPDGSDTAGHGLLAVRADGTRFPVEETTSEVVVRGQRLLTSVLRDVTERAEAQRTLLESEARFKATFDQAAVGIAHVGLDGRWLEVNQRLCDIVGYPREELLTLSFPEMTYEDDLEESQANAEHLLAGRISTYSMQKRYYRKGGSLIWVNVTVSLRKGENGETPYFIRVVEDITEIKRAEVALQAAREDLERRVEERTSDLQRLSGELQTQVGELELRNVESRVLSEMSEMLQACFTFREIDQVVAQHASQLFQGFSGKLYAYGASRSGLEELVSWNGAAASTFLFGPEECWGLRRGRLFASSAGRLSCQHHHAVGATLCVPMLAQGETVGLLYLEGGEQAFTRRQEQLAQTVAETVALAMVNLRLRETLRQQSIRDPLTGLFNRRYLEETFERELRRAERKDECIGVIMLDVDRFKTFNDTHGHEAGDTLLKALGGVLKDNVRAEDVACRYGGEEFTLLLTGADQQQTFDRAEQIRGAVTRLRVTNQGKVLDGVSASMGVATFPQHGRDLAGLVRAADLALYRAKHEGRNRVINAD
ncbi:diguanylate cyclase [Deinococcus altitudinis]|uniref:diguanylate cyclase n=1 Tax=Deinococcus altitudinis TaxID=468914 RepID=UPI003891BE0E